MLAAPARDFQRLRGEHQEAAGEERDERKHVHVDAIGARERGAAFLDRLDRRDVRARGKQRLDARAHCLAVRAGGESQVDAIQLPGPSEPPLRRGDVGERGDPAQARRGKNARDLELDHLEAGDHAQFFALAQSRLEGNERHVGLQQRKPPLGLVQEQGGLDRGRAQRIDPDQADRAPAGETRIELEHRARHRDAGNAGERGVQRLGKAGAAAAHLEVRFARERAHARRQLLDRGAVDQADGEAERDPERDAGDREEVAPALVRQAPVEGGEKAQQAERARDAPGFHRPTA